MLNARPKVTVDDGNKDLSELIIKFRARYQIAKTNLIQLVVVCVVCYAQSSRYIGEFRLKDV